MKLKLKQVKESALSFLKTYKAIYKTENGKEIAYFNLEDTDKKIRLRTGTVRSFLY